MAGCDYRELHNKRDFAILRKKRLYYEDPKDMKDETKKSALIHTCAPIIEPLCKQYDFFECLD